MHELEGRRWRAGKGGLQTSELADVNEACWFPPGCSGSVHRNSNHLDGGVVVGKGNEAPRIRDVSNRHGFLLRGHASRLVAAEMADARRGAVAAAEWVGPAPRHVDAGHI